MWVQALVLQKYSNFVFYLFELFFVHLYFCNFGFLKIWILILFQSLQVLGALLVSSTLIGVYFWRKEQSRWRLRKICKKIWCQPSSWASKCKTHLSAQKMFCLAVDQCKFFLWHFHLLVFHFHCHIWCPLSYIRLYMYFHISWYTFTLIYVHLLVFHFHFHIRSRTWTCFIYVYILGCFRKTLFWENEKYNPPRISLGVSLKESKRIFDFDKV